MGKMKFVIFLLVSVMLIPAGAMAEKGVTEYKVGDLRLFSILDTPMEVGADLLIGDKQEIEKYVPTGKCVGSLNAFLLVDGKDIILFDTGLGTFGNGKLIDQIIHMGIKPENVTKIFFTHLHGDHLGGSLYTGKKVFPKAELYVSAEELGFWGNKKNTIKSSNTFDAVEKLKNAYGDSLKTFKAGVEVVKGIKPIAAFGHTVGHTVYEISSKGEKLFIWGDTMHCFAAQSQNPAISIAYDSDKTKAVDSRAKILKEVTSGGSGVIAGSHMPYPGVIKIMKNGDKYEFEPVVGK